LFSGVGDFFWDFCAKIPFPIVSAGEAEYYFMPILHVSPGWRGGYSFENDP